MAPRFAREDRARASSRAAGERTALTRCRHRRAASNPAPNAARLLLTPTRPRRIAASNAVRWNGSAPEPASAPNSTALTSAAGGVRHRRHVEGTQPARRVAARRLQQRRARRRGRRRARSSPVIAKTRWVDAISVVLVRRHEAALTARAAFHQFGRQHDVDVARHRHQAPAPASARRLRRGFREQLDIIDGRAGALGDAGHRGRLREIAAVIGEIDDPVGQHAAALAAHRKDRDRDRPDARSRRG